MPLSLSTQKERGRTAAGKNPEAQLPGLIRGRGPARIIARIHDPVTIEKILIQLKRKDAAATARSPPSRAPTQPSSFGGNVNGASTGGATNGAAGSLSVRDSVTFKNYAGVRDFSQLERTVQANPALKRIVATPR